MIAPSEKGGGTLGFRRPKFSEPARRLRDVELNVVAVGAHIDALLMPAVALQAVQSH